jgi:hypothetical protein
MTEAHLGIVAAALGLVSHLRAQGIDMGAPGRELLAEIDRAMPGTIAGFNAICPERRSVPKRVKLRNNPLLHVIRQRLKVAPIKKVEADSKAVDQAKRLR